MKEKPILFSGPMVRAILEGRKTQTRRVVNPQPDMTCESFVAHGNEWLPRVTAEENGELVTRGDVYGRLSCPYGQPGDKLWVRETWGVHECIHEAYQRDRCQVGVGLLHYKADEGCHPVKRWRPSIHMPRWASRIALEVTAVRVERLASLTVADAVAEGIGERRGRIGPWSGALMYGLPDWKMDECHVTAREAYLDLWDRINAKRGVPSWKNPWVWVVEFQTAGQ